jgi:hypothetical protein
MICMNTFLSSWWVDNTAFPSLSCCFMKPLRSTTCPAVRHC